MNRPRLLLLAPLLLAACGRSPEGSSRPAAEGPPVDVSVETLAPRMEDVLYRASGTVRARNTARLRARLLAEVREVRVTAGDRVRRGQVLVVLDAAELEAQAGAALAGADEVAEARVEAESALRAAEAQARLAEASHARMVALDAARAASAQEMDESAARREAALAARDGARARLKLLERSARRAGSTARAAGATASYTRVAAPFDGWVTARAVEPGNLVTPGDPLVTVDEDGPYRVEAFVDESRAAEVVRGDPARVELDPSGPVAATVVEVEPAVDAASHAFRVKVELDDPPGDRTVRPGMFARVLLTVGHSERLSVPRAALRRSGDLDLVLVVEDGRARQRLVTLGQEGDGRVEVRTGLAAGERLITAPPGLRDGQPVRAVP